MKRRTVASEYSRFWTGNRWIGYGFPPLAVKEMVGDKREGKLERVENVDRF